jgi:hypothetical protein
MNILQLMGSQEEAMEHSVRVRRERDSLYHGEPIKTLHVYCSIKLSLGLPAVVITSYCVRPSKQIFPETEKRYCAATVPISKFPGSVCPFCLQENMWTNPVNICTHRHMNVEIGTGPRNSFSGNT